MREFALPDDLAEIPLQGYRGSYAVIDLQAEGEDRMDIFVIKVIHGEEKSTFFRSYISETEGTEGNGRQEITDQSAHRDGLDVTGDYEQFIRDLAFCHGL